MTTNREASRAGHALLCVCGGIAAYKAVEVLRGLQKSGCEVRVACTEDALRFVGAATWEGLTHERMGTTVYDWPSSRIPHVGLAKWADVAVVVPATANVIAKLAHGIADDLVSTTLLAVSDDTPLVVAPAMNVHMWNAPSTRDNVRTLERRGVSLVLPVSGRLACADEGAGKLAPVDDIVARTLEELRLAPRTLEGRCVMVTAGPTHEAIDPVRYIANASSGKMGYAIAGEALRRGAEVILVSGPVSLSAPCGVRLVSVTSAEEMHRAATTAFAEADVAICAAAVADYTPVRVADHKLKKDHERLDVIELRETTDILASLCANKRRDDGSARIVVGFAAETNDVLAHAAKKLARKGCDLLVANDVSREDSGFGTDTNRVWLVSHDGVDALPTLGKDEVARRLLDRVEDLLTTT